MAAGRTSAKHFDSPTASLASIDILLRMTVEEGYHKRGVDVAGAHLNAGLQEPEFTRIPRSVINIIEAETESDGQSDAFD